MSIKKIETDMPFPVFSMEADHDYILARLVSFLGGSFASKAGFFGQQACEKYLKALSVQHGKFYLDTHKLHKLAAACDSYGDFFSGKETLRILEQFDVFDQIGRYGGAAKFDPLSKGFSMGGASLKIGAGVRVAGAWIWTPKHLHDLDGFVFHARSHLDFSAAKFGDGIRGILENNKNSSMLGQWRFPIPLRQILTTENNYFKP